MRIDCGSFAAALPPAFYSAKNAHDLGNTDSTS